MIKINVSPQIYDACPELVISAIECGVDNSLHNNELWKEIEHFCAEFKSANKIEDINQRAAIKATRDAYKKLGKDPNRYRPSAEALCRRTLKDMPLYQINTLVDLINLVSLKTGYSIGGFDAEKINGNLQLGVGTADEQFEAIGRGFLNIDGLPVYRDNTGGIGTPTSDEERTKISLETKRILMIINGYSGRKGLQEATEYSIELLKKYANGADFSIQEIKR